jgi:hypothetical protein
MKEFPLMVPGEAGVDSTGEPADPAAAKLARNVRNGDLRADQADPSTSAPTSDSAPDDFDAPFLGAPLTDAEVDALPVELDDGP